MSDQEPDPADAPGVEQAESFADAADSATPEGVATVVSEQSELPTYVGNTLGNEVGEAAVEPFAAAAVKPKRRAGWVVALGVGYVVLAAGTAFGVIADKSPAAVDVTAVNASAYAAPIGSASAHASSSASAGAKASSSASASASAAPTTSSASPTPKSTVIGSVHDGVHSGDLRYFLYPPPQGPSSVQGDPDGNKDTLDEAVQVYGGSSSQDSILSSYHFKAACDRTFQDSTIGANVSIELIQFESADDAQQWTDGFSLNGSGFASISVPGESGAKGWSYSKDGNYQLVGMYREGDTFFQVTVYGTQSVPASALGQLVSGQHSRLANG